MSRARISALYYLTLRRAESQRVYYLFSSLVVESFGSQRAKFVRRSKTILIKTPLGPTKYYRGTLIYCVSSTSLFLCVFFCVSIYIKFSIFAQSAIWSKAYKCQCDALFMHGSVWALVRVVSSQPEHYSLEGGGGRNSFVCLFNRRSGDVNSMYGNSENNLILLIDSSLNDFIVNA